MLTRLIVDLYAWIVEAALWLAILISGVAGYHLAAPIFGAAGLIPSSQVTGKFIGALAFAFAAFLVLAVLAGPVLLLVDIRKSVRALETRSSGNSSTAPTTEQKEPVL